MLNPISGLRPASANPNPISEKSDSDEFAQLMGDASGADSTQVDVSGSKDGKKDSKNEKEAAASAQAQQLYNAQLKIQGQQPEKVNAVAGNLEKISDKAVNVSGQANDSKSLVGPDSEKLKQELKDSIVGAVERNGKRLNDESQVESKILVPNNLAAAKNKMTDATANAATSLAMNASTSSATNPTSGPATKLSTGPATNSLIAAQAIQAAKLQQGVPGKAAGQSKVAEKQGPLTDEQVKASMMNVGLAAMQQPLNAAQVLSAAPVAQSVIPQTAAKQAGPGVSSLQVTSALNPMTAKDVMGLSDDQTLVIPNDGHVMSIIPGSASQSAQQGQGAQQSAPAYNNTSTENFLAARMAGQQSAAQAAAQLQQQNSPILNQAAFNSESSASGMTGASLKSEKKPAPNLNLIHNQVQYNAAGNPMLTMDAPVAKGAGPKTTLSHESVQQLGYAIGGLQKTSPQGGEIKLKLKPNNMGEVKVDVRTEGGKVSLKIEAADESSRRLIESSLKTLEDGLKNNHGLSLSRVEVLVGQDSRIMQPSSAASSPMDGMSWNAFSGNNASDSGGQRYLDRQETQNAYEQGQRSAGSSYSSSDEPVNSWNQRRRNTDQRLDMIA